MVCSNKTKLQEFLGFDEDQMVLELEGINFIVRNHIDIVPKIAFPDFKLKFSAEKSDLEQVDKFLNTMHQFDFEKNNRDDALKLLEESFLIEKNWICHTCRHQNKTILSRKTDRNIPEDIAKNKL